MACGHCKDCGTGLERNGVCPNCDEAAHILDWEDPERPVKHTQEFLDEAAAGHDRASKREGGSK